MPEVVRKADIDRERERLSEHAGEFPALRLLLDDLPGDYDPQSNPVSDREPEPDE